MTGKLVNGQPPPEEPRGRRFELLEACAAGADLLVEPAYVVAPAQFTAEACCHCLRVLSDEERDAATATAHRCGVCDADETRFCSEVCRERWGVRHELECPLIEPLLGLLFDAPEVEMHNAILVLRLLAERLMVPDQHLRGDEPAAPPEDLQSVRWSAARALQSHINQFAHKSLLSLARSMAEIFNRGRPLHTSVSTIKGLLCAVHFNAFAIRSAKICNHVFQKQ